MSLPVKWSPAARDEFATLLEYFEGAFGLEAALKPLDRTEEMVTQIAASPEMYPASRKKEEIRKATVSKQTTLYYRLTTDEIQLLHFWDSRQDPVKLEIKL